MDIATVVGHAPLWLIVTLFAVGMAIGGLMLRNAEPGQHGHMKPLGAPGWIARWKARRGVSHPRNAVSLGYQSAMQQVTLSKRELNHHGSIFGGPGSGKTTLIALLAQGHARLGPSIILDGKGSLDLRSAVLASGGKVWTIGGSLMLDLLDPDPTILGDQLTEATRHEGPSEVYSEAAVRTLQWIGHVLQWSNEAPTLEAIEELLLPGALRAQLTQHQQRPRVRRWLQEIDGMQKVELSGVATALMRVTKMLDSAAGPSLGSGSAAIRLEDVVQGKTTFLISLDSRRYPSLSRILAGWALIGMQRACSSVPKGTSCLMLLDEIAAFGWQARHIEPLLAQARDTGVGVVLAGHGPTQVDSAVHNMTSQILQETSWQIVLAQGDPDDADRLSRLFPLDYTQPVHLGRVATGVPTVTRDHLQALTTGECFFRVRPVGGGGGSLRWGRARVALPGLALELPVEIAMVAELGENAEPGLTDTSADTSDFDLTDSKPDDADTDVSEEALLKRETYRRMRWQDGWRMWPDSAPFDSKGWPRVWLPAHMKDGRQVPGRWIPSIFRHVYNWEHPDAPIPRGWSYDHDCGLKRCFDHGVPRTIADNKRRERLRARGELPIGHAGMVPPVSQPNLWPDEPA